ncbi:MAG: hypothetical protein ACP5IB_09615 [Thermoplasmata archaeon]
MQKKINDLIDKNEIGIDEQKVRDPITEAIVTYKRTYFLKE